MAGPYTFTLYEHATEFDFDNQHYSPGDTYGPVDACAMKAFINAFTSAGNAGITEESATVAQLEEECPATPNNATPQNDAGSPPVETNPATTGGDSATNQGSPQPGTTGGVGQTIGGETPPADPPPGEEPTRPQNGQADIAHGGERTTRQTEAGDPIDIFTGACYFEETDLAIPNTLLPLSFTRVYRSGAPAYGPLGWNWDHNYNLYLRELSDGNIALWRNLHEDLFGFDGAAFQPPRGVFERLVPLVGLAQVYEIGAENGIVMRFERPPSWIDGERIPIKEIRDRHGNKLRFSYHSNDRLAEVRDDDDRFLKFEYDKCELLIAVSDHAGRKYQYIHDEQTNQLTCVTSPATADLPQGWRRIYHYEDPFATTRLRHNIVRVEDGDGNTYLEYGYEQDPASWSYGRVTEQLLGGFLYQLCYSQLQWVPADPVYINTPSVLVEVMNPDFGLESYTFNYRGDLLDRRFRLSKDKSYRVVVARYEFDEQGNLSVITHPDGSQEIYTYDFGNADPRLRGKLLRKEITAASGFPSPSRIVWRGKYESTYGLLIEERDELNQITKYRYDFDTSPGALDNSGRLTRIERADATLPDGSVQSCASDYENNTKGQVVAAILPDGIRNEMSYGAAGEARSRVVTQMSDVGGLAINTGWDYDTFGNVANTTDGNGNISGRVTNALGLPERVFMPSINGGNGEVVVRYNADRHFVRVERPKGSFVDPLAAGVRIFDDVARNVLGHPMKYVFSVNSSESRTVQVCSDYRGFPVETIQPDGSRVKRFYDERGLVILEEVKGTDGTSVKTQRVYDRRGNLVRETNANGLVTQYRYDGFSRSSKVILPNGSEIDYVWGPRDLMVSESVTGDDGFGTNRLLRRKTYTYDEKSRKVSDTLEVFEDNPAAAASLTTEYFHDAMDRMVKVVDPRGGERFFEFDGLGRMTKEIDPMGNEDRHSHDDNGNVLRTESHQEEPNGSVSVVIKIFRYDARNRRIETVEPDGARTVFEYDDRDLLVREVDRLGFVKALTYNSFKDRLRMVQAAGLLNISHQWTVDVMSRITSYIDPSGEISTYHADGLGRINRIEYPNGFSSTRLLNGAGQVVREQLSSGVVFEYDYDTFNQLSRIRNPTVAAGIIQIQDHEFAYDGLSRIVRARVGTNEVIRRHDSNGRLYSETTHGAAMECHYHDLAGTTRQVWPDGRTEVSSHDLNGTLLQIEQTANGALGAGLGQLASFQPSGPKYLGTATYRSNLTISSSYDERKRLTRLAITSPVGLNETLEYRYDTSNRARVETITGSNPKISLFDFDAVSRLSSAKSGFATVVPGAANQADHDAAVAVVQGASAGAAQQELFEYNSSDDRTKYTDTGTPVRNYSYLPGHRLQNDSLHLHSYIPDGTVRDDAIFTYRSDALGRVRTVQSGASILYRIDYDAFGRPSVLTETGAAARSLNYLGGFAAQENQGGAASRQLTLHPTTGIPIAYHTAGEMHYTLFDARYNLIGLADANGNLVETYRYKAFGLPTIYDAARGVLAASAHGIEPIFGGQRFVPSIGLYLTKRRLMNPVNGVFYLADPKGSDDSPSLYVYAAQNPIDNIDPDGEVIPLIVAAVVIGGALVGAGYSVYDSIERPSRYAGWQGSLRVLGNVFGGAAIGGISVVAGEAVLAAGGVGIFASGTGATLTVGQSFLLYGTSSAVSGSILRGGFNQLFPDYINPVSTGTVAVDFVAGGSIGAALRGLTNLAQSPGFGQFAWIPGGGRFSQWLRFGADAGGSAAETGTLGPYPGTIGKLLDRIGVRQGTGSTLVNSDLGTGNLFGSIDTGAHEGFHALVARYFPTFRNLSATNSLGAIARYPEEVVAYAIGRGAAGRVHAVPFAPFEAFNSLAGYGQPAVVAAKIFWGRITGGVAVGTAERLLLNDPVNPGPIKLPK